MRVATTETALATVRFSLFASLPRIITGIALIAAGALGSWSVFDILWMLIGTVLTIAGLGLLTQRGLVVMPREVVVQNMLGGPVRRYPFERLSDLVVTGEDLYVAGTPVVLATRFSNLSAEDWRAMELELRAAAREWDGEEEEDGAEEDDHEDDE